MTIPVIQEEWPELDYLSDQTVSLWFELNLYKNLFFSHDDNIYLMNRGANHFFYMLSFTLPVNITRVLATLYDRPNTGRNRNITIESICIQSSMWCRASSTKECHRILSSQSHNIGKLRRFRNKKLVHLDHGIAAGGQVQGLSFKQMRELAEAAASILNTIRSDVFGGHTAYDGGISHAPMDILGCIKDSLWQWELRKLLRLKLLTEDEAGRIIYHGEHGLAWKTWCTKQGVVFDYYTAKHHKRPYDDHPDK